MSYLKFRVLINWFRIPLTMPRIPKVSLRNTAQLASTSVNINQDDNEQSKKAGRSRAQNKAEANTDKLHSKLKKELAESDVPSKIGTLLADFKPPIKPKLKRTHLEIEYEGYKNVDIKEESCGSQESKLSAINKYILNMEKGLSDFNGILKIKEEFPECTIEGDKDILKVKSDDSGIMSSPIKIPKFSIIAPLNWEEVLDNIRVMRRAKDAPVDTMGCDMCYDKSGSPKDTRYQKLISLMLSSMTKDNTTYNAMQRLIEYGCTVDRMMGISEEHLGQLIAPVNYWKKKAQYIKQSTKMIQDEFDGDIPKTVKDLSRLKGVGPKMAHLCMSSAWNEVTGIGVDTHVHRISNRLGWVSSKNPDGTRKQLEEWLPQPYWREVNHLLVGFGQQHCEPVKPKCSTCLNNRLCPFGIKELGL